MRYLKRNNSFFIVGEQETPFELTQLDDFGIRHNSILINKLDLSALTYPEINSKASRLHSNRMKMIFECLHRLDFNKKKQNYDSERIGIYVNGAHNYVDQDYPDFKKLQSGITLYQLFRSSISPTHGIKNDIGVMPGHIAIFCGIHGPTMAVSSLAKNQILEKAWMDLQSKIIDIALVCYVNTYAGAFNFLWHFQSAHNKRLTEAAGVLLLTRDDPFPFEALPESPTHHFGYLNEFGL